MASLPEQDLRTLAQLEELQETLRRAYVGRDDVIRVLALAAVCQEHVVVLGPPGTGKTDLVNRFVSRVGDASSFSYLLTRFTEPTEIFGAPDILAFKNNEYRVAVEGMLPEADIAFLDEVFEGSSAILNTLLTVMQERVFFNGSERVRTPLLTLVGAANDLPGDPTLAAFGDRFLLRVHARPVAETRLDELIRSGWEADRSDRDDAPEHVIAVSRLRQLGRRTLDIHVGDIRPVYRRVVTELLTQHGVVLSDRRIVRGLKLVAGAALLRREDDAARPRDLWPLRYFWTDAADAEAIAAVVDPLVEADGGEQRRPTRTVREILFDAENVRDRARALRDTTTWAQQGQDLRDLQRLRRELIEGHPSDQAAETVLRQVIDEVGRP
jgi:MoxR-like ATPase